MWTLLGIIFLIVAIALLDCIRKPPKVKEGQKPLTKRDYIIGASVCGILSLVFFGMNDSAFIWNLISIISFIGIFVFFIWAIVSLFKKNGTAKKKFMYTGACFIAFLIGAVNSPPNEQPQSISTSKETSAPVIDQKSSENEEAKKKEAEVLAAKRAAEEKAKQEAVKKNTEQKVQQPTETVPLKQEQLPAQITKAGGLGDTYDIFVQNYGVNIGDQMMARFQNDYIHSIFVNERAMNITLQFEATSQSYRSKKEALALAEEVIPIDAKKIKEYSDDPGRIVIEYTSKKLAKVMNKESFGSAKPGTFLVIIRSNSQGVFAVTIGTGNNP